MVGVVRLGPKAYGVQDATGAILETRGSVEHAMEVLLRVTQGRRYPTEAKQVVRDGHPVVLVKGTSSIVSKEGRVFIRVFDTRREAILWLREYRRLCLVHRGLIDASPNDYRVRMVQGEFPWAVFVNRIWTVSFRGKSAAHKFIHQEARRDSQGVE